VVNHLVHKKETSGKHLTMLGMFPKALTEYYLKFDLPIPKIYSNVNYVFPISLKAYITLCAFDVIIIIDVIL